MITIAILIIAALVGLSWLATKVCDLVWFKALNPAIIKRLQKVRLTNAVVQRWGRKPTRDEWRAIEEELRKS